MSGDDTKKKQYITVEIAGREIRFDRDLAFQHYDTFMNTAGAGKLAKAANNFCIAAVHKEDLVTFRDLKKQNPSTAIQVASELADVIAPDLEVTVKKS